jgi:hypothetical protein
MVLRVWVLVSPLGCRAGVTGVVTIAPVRFVCGNFEVGNFSELLTAPTLRFQLQT